MPIPFVEECQTSMSSASSAKADILEAIERIRGLADDETWSGTPAENWMTDLEGHLADAEAALGEPLQQAMQQCLSNAQEMQVKSGQQSVGSTP